ncbi:hypothetical protein MishRS11D_46610 (plasmid) [Methylomagnum ishizawai]|nr:hypothetical protein MishRS11D_46610 [Methylomagnum ishizawai]
MLRDKPRVSGMQTVWVYIIGLNIARRMRRHGDGGEFALAIQDQRGAIKPELQEIGKQEFGAFARSCATDQDTVPIAGQ